MALRDVTLKVGETLRVMLDHSGPVRQLELKLGPDGFTISQAFEAAQQPALEAEPAPTPRKPTGKFGKPEPAPEPVAAKRPTAPVRQPAPRTPTKPIIDEPVESVQAVDIPMDDLLPPGSGGPVEVRDEGSDEIDDADFNLGDEAPSEEAPAGEPMAEQAEGTDAMVSETDAPLDDNLVEDAPADDIPLDDVSVEAVAEGGNGTADEAMLEGEPMMDTQAPFDAGGVTMPPQRAGSAPALQTDEPEDMPLSLDEEPPQEEPVAAPPARASARAGAKPAAAPPGESGDLPAWTGRARDYKDPVLENRKAATRKLTKPGARGGMAPNTNFNQEVNMGEEPPVDIPTEDGPDIDIPLDLEEEAKPAPAKKPSVKLPAKALGKSATGSIKAPAKPAPGPAKTLPGKAGASGKAPAADGGAFTVFLSPPKGADKKQAAAEIIAEINSIDIDAAMQLAGKMIVPVVKGVSENEANRVRDKFKEAGLSCRITQKR